MTKPVEYIVKLASRRYEKDDEFKGLVDCWIRMINDNNIDINDFEQASKLVTATIKNKWVNS